MNSLFPAGASRRLARTTSISVLLVLASSLVLIIAYQFPTTTTLDVGSGYDTPFVQGFSFREDLPGGNFRWSGPGAELRFWGLGAQNGTLKLSLAAPRPDRPARVQIFANDSKLGDLAPGGGFQEFAFPIDRQVFGPAGDLVVRLVSDTFTQPPDTRELGVQVDSARFEASGGPVMPTPRALYVVALVLLAFFITHAWTGSSRVGILSSSASLALAGWGVAATRGETVWFAAPLFWSGAALFIAALLFSRFLQRWVPGVDDRTLRLLFGAMVLAFAVRMALAMGPGFVVDVQDYVVWSYKTVTYGLASTYEALNGLWIADQSPGIVYLLHLMGLVYRAVFSPDFLYPGVAGDPAIRAAATNPALLADPVQRTLLRMPSLFADLVTGALIFAAARNKLSVRGAWLLAFGYWLNPAVLWNGAYWGQMDAVHALLVLGAFLLLDAKRIAAAFFVLGVAALTKPQAAVFGPLLLLWAFREENWRGVARASIAGAVGAAVTFAPLLLADGAGGLLAYLGDTVGHHPILSANAHNLWWFVMNGRIDVPDTREIVSGFPFTYRAGSLILFGLFYLITLGRAGRERRTDYFALGAFVAFAFFMLPTEIHENYGYALLPVLAVALARDKNWLVFYLAVSLTMVLNYALSDPPLFALWGLDDPVGQLAGPRFWNSAANVVLFAAWAIYLFARRGVVIQARLEPQGVAR